MVDGLDFVKVYEEGRSCPHGHEAIVWIRRSALVVGARRSGIFTAIGFNGQTIVVDPRRDLVLVRLGISNPQPRVQVIRNLDEAVQSFPLAES